MKKLNLKSIKKDLNDEFRIREEDIYQRVEKLLLDKVAAGGPNRLKAGAKITEAYLNELTT